MRKTMLAGAMALLSAVTAMAQVSGYASGTYRYHTNPLYNYEMIADQVKEGYWEMKYTGESERKEVTVGYVGGLMLFNKLLPRNYYEHRLTFGLVTKFPAPEATPEAFDGESPFKGDQLKFGGQIGARHDRAEFQEYDNWGADLTASYTWGVGRSRALVLENEAGIRRYTSVSDLNNLHDILTLTSKPQGGLALGYRASVGVKHYTTAVVDSTQLATEGSGTGKGNGGGGNPNASKKKAVVVNASTTTSFQLTAGLTLAGTWSNGGLESYVLLRFSPSKTMRTVSQYDETTFLNEDIYNDFFNHEGPEAKISLRQGLPLGFQLIVHLEAQRKNYLGPAVDLSGVQTADRRLDIRGSAEFYLSRYIGLGDAFGLDVALSGGVLRNQSNDQYNDFSLANIGISLGAGF